MDAAIGRDFKFNERLTLDTRVDGFDITNHPNFGGPTPSTGVGLGPNATYSSSNFGRIATAGDPASSRTPLSSSSRLALKPPGQSAYRGKAKRLRPCGEFSQLNFNRPPIRGLQAKTSYTYSHATDRMRRGFEEWKRDQVRQSSGGIF